MVQVVDHVTPRLRLPPPGPARRGRGSGRRACCRDRLAWGRAPPSSGWRRRARSRPASAPSGPGPSKLLRLEPRPIGHVPGLGVLDVEVSGELSGLGAQRTRKIGGNPTKYTLRFTSSWEPMCSRRDWNASGPCSDRGSTSKRHSCSNRRHERDEWPVGLAESGGPCESAPSRPPVSGERSRRRGFVTAGALYSE